MVCPGQTSIHTRVDRRLIMGEGKGGLVLVRWRVETPATGKGTWEVDRSRRTLGFLSSFQILLSANPAEAEASEFRIHIHIHTHYAPATPPQGLMR